MDENSQLRRPRIAHIISGLGTGGAERALLSLLGGGLSERFDSLVISLGDEGTMGRPISETGARVQTLDIGVERHYLAAVPLLRRMIVEFEPAVIQGWMYHGNLASTLARSFLKGDTRLAWNVRQTLYDLALEKTLTRWVIRANRALSRKPDTVLYNSRLARQQHEQFGFSDSNGARIPNGIDLDKFSYSETRRTAGRRELGLPDDCIVIGHVARFHPMKDHGLFIRVVESLAEIYPDVRFLMIGKGVSWDHEEFAALSKGASRERILALGERHDIPELYSAMDALCLSSSWGEGFPNVLGEAMATGLPCVATDVGDSAVVVGDTGAIIDSQDDNALRDALKKLLDMSSTERRALGRSALERIRANFALDKIVQQYVSLYERLLQSQGVH